MLEGGPRASRLSIDPRPRLGLEYCVPATGALSPRHGNARHPSCDPATTGPQHVPVGPSHRGIPMKRWLLAAAALMVGAACDTQRDAAAPQRTVDPALRPALATATPGDRSEEHTSELQSHSDLVCRLLLEKKKNKK